MGTENYNNSNMGAACAAAGRHTPYQGMDPIALHNVHRRHHEHMRTCTTTLSTVPPHRRRTPLPSPVMEPMFQHDPLVPFKQPEAPLGSWKATARNIRVTQMFGKFTVHCLLQNSNGIWVLAQTHFLPGEHFENDNGVFRKVFFNRSDIPKLPKGSWIETARRVQMHRAANGDGWILKAELQDSNGVWRKSKVRFYPKMYQYVHFENRVGSFVMKRSELRPGFESRR